MTHETVRGQASLPGRNWPGLSFIMGVQRDPILWYDRDLTNSYLFRDEGYYSSVHMFTSSNGMIFRVTDHLCGELTGPRWIPRTKASDAELWCFLWSASE